MSLARRTFIAGSALAAGAFGIVRGQARGAQFEFKIGSVLAQDHPNVTNLVKMYDTVEKESSGRIHASVFPNNQLGNESSMFTQVRAGAIQMMIISPGFLSSVVPASEISNLGFAFKDSDDALKTMDGPLGNFVRDEISGKGLYALRGMMDGGMYQVGSATKAIHTPDDLTGFKIRVVGKIAVDLFKELGANAVSMNLADVYTGLQTRLIDGEAAPAVVIETSKFWEVQKFLCLTNHAWSAEWMIVNGDLWKSMPADLKAIIERNHVKYLAACRGQMKTENLGMIAKIKAHGLTAVDIDQSVFRARLKNYYLAWSKEFGPTEWGYLETAIGRKLT